MKTIDELSSLVSRLGFALDDEQVHIGGERAVISRSKHVLLGRRLADGARVVIKVTSTAEGRAEMERERVCREALAHIEFAYNTFLSPEQLTWHDEGECLVSVTAFIEQDRPFLERPLREQFFLAMKSFETQESAHVTTYEHARMIRETFGVVTTEEYLKTFADNMHEIQTYSHQADSLLARAETFLHASQDRIEQYGGFLTHTDFVPHNFRVVGHEMYLLDHSSIRFGNKYEGWARFLNWMLLYHRDLERALLVYVKHNRAPEESQALHAMRVYRLGEIICYYARRAQKNSGDLQTLDRARMGFWTDVLRSVLDDYPLPEERIDEYRSLRDRLRSVEEKRRQSVQFI